MPGAVTATAGGTIASATWNNINTDYQNTLTSAGSVVFTQSGLIRYVIRSVSLSTTNTDLAISIPVSNLPGGANSYYFNNFYIANATANASTASIGIFTATGGGGVALMPSIAVNITATSPGTANNMQFFLLNTGLSFFTLNPIYFRTMSSSAAAKVDLFLEIRSL